jgi:hypothetical protein
VIESSRPPSILVDKVITFEEAEELFKVYFDYCHRQYVEFDFLISNAFDLFVFQ